MQTMCSCGDTQATSDASGIQESKKQVADLKSQLTSRMRRKKTASPKQGTVKVTKNHKPDYATIDANLPSHRAATSKQKPWYCFTVGRMDTLSEANPALVASS